VTRIHRLALLLLACSCVLSSAPRTHAQQLPEKMFQEMRWRMIGPFRASRTRAVAGVPSQPNLFYIGVVNGGVWKSDDYGRTWAPIFDAQPTQSIGDIAVAPSDPNVIYVATGEGLPRPDLSIGNGIYKSTDAGKTWTHLGLPDAQQVPALAVDPRNPDRVFAAVLGHPYGPSAERGIFRSLDGGKTWQKVLYKDENTGGADLQIDPANPDVVYASLWETRLGPWEDGNQYSGAGGGLFKSTDGGSTWRKLTGGLPPDVVQLHLAIAPSQTSRLYAVFSTTTPSAYATGKGMGLYRSEDGGETWSKATDDPRPVMKIGGGDLPMLRVDPKDPDVVYSASLVALRSTDGGKSWTSIRGAPGGDDYQHLWINPNHPNIILMSSDQGAIVTVNGGRTWSSWYNQPTAQLYHAITDHSFPYKVCGGQQESGSVCISSRGNGGRITFRDWHPAGVIEYGYVAPDPLDADLVYGAGRNEVSRYHWSTGQKEDVTPIPIRGDKYRTERTEPIVFSPLNPRLLYYASNILFQTTDGGANWQAISPDLARKEQGVSGLPAGLGALAAKDPKAPKQRGAIYSLAPSFQSVNTLWAGTDDGLIWITRDGGKIWKDITPPELTPWSKVTQLQASHFDGQSAYASVSRFRIDDLHPCIYRTRDGGKSWQRITTGLPDSPVNTVREDPVRKGLLFAGTETGVWMSFDDGDHWQPLQLNLPHTSMRDLWIHESDLIVATHGRSFWILDNITPLRQASAAVASSKAFLFQPAPAYRVQRDANTDTPLPADEPAGKNPPDGAVMDYFLSQPASAPVTLEVLDNTNQVVRRYSSADQPEQTSEQLKKERIAPVWLRKFKALPTTEGMHRWVWDLRYPSPTATEHEYPIAAAPHRTPRGPLGPRALPGQYRVRLTVDGQTLTAPLTVKMDPRVRTPLAALRRRFELEKRLASMLSESSEAVLLAQSLRQQIKALSPQGDGAPQGPLQDLDAKLALLLDGPKDAPAGKPKEPALDAVNGNVGTLYGMAGMADAPPTLALTTAAATAERDLAPLLKRWDAIKTVDVPTLNQRLRDAKLPELKLEAERDAEENTANEE